ncbi:MULTISPECIES: GNAT family N-acetyltransferase [Actinoalloteichus]|uniref:Acyltransferase n=1 Tax=Actinoalloteichus fjordicus TaxID=1612552 RepID=A0AAC9LAB3_9PSEU|nr:MULTISPECIES: GNAT family N-acetyltransferase [Actinoalloteichus]APU13891.1 putative acyltransferase [Actinoalloteichus fjordicus]APU19837.1 putative acyltransferase [Actinoalloteichus sp. GBA129-24]
MRAYSIEDQGRPTDGVVVHRAAGDELTAQTLYGLLRLRSAVFVVEQDCAYLDPDGRDLAPDTRHLWLTDAGSTEPAAVLRLLAEPAGVVRVGRVCTASAARGRGLARTLMTAALAEIGSATSVLAAQVTVVDFYRSFGYQESGEAFDEDGIRHQPMTRPGVDAG